MTLKCAICDKELKSTNGLRQWRRGTIHGYGIVDICPECDKKIKGIKNDK